MTELYGLTDQDYEKENEEPFFTPNFVELSPEEVKLQEIAARYHEICDNYDNEVCTGPVIDGSARPNGQKERRMSVQNAIQTKSALSKEARNYGFNDKEIQKAISKASQFRTRERVDFQPSSM